MQATTLYGACQYIEMEREGSRKRDLSPSCQPTTSSWEQLWWQSALKWLPRNGRPEMAALQVSWCGGQWPSVPQVGHLRWPVWALSAAICNTALREKHRNQHCGKISRAGDRHFLGVLQVYMIYNGVFSNTGSPPDLAPCFRRKLLKIWRTFSHFKSFGLAVAAARYSL